MESKVKKPPSTAPSSAPPSASPSFPFVSVFVVVVAVVVAGLAVVDPSEFLSTYLGVSSNDTVVHGKGCALAEQYLTDVMPVKGFHVLCIDRVQKGESLVLNVTVFKDGNAPSIKTQSLVDMADLKKHVETLLEIEEPKEELAIKYKQPYAFFTPDGQRLDKMDDLVDKVVFLFEGGQFIWPGIRVGHKTVVKDVIGKGDVVLETLSMIPLVFSVEEFLKDDEIDIILDLSLEHLKPSSVVLKDGDENEPVSEFRTSSTYFLPSNEHPKLHEVDQRVADITKVPVAHQEYDQVLRYKEAEKYDHHTDYFPVEGHQDSPEILESIDYGYKNRMVTVFWYMSDVAKGGHTVFPRAGGAPLPKSRTDCTVGLKVSPKKRKAIAFYSLLPSGEADPFSLHGGCPVEEGIKYACNKSIWNKAMPWL